MPLSCECETELEDGYTYYDPPSDYSVLGTSKRQRCWSCRKLIDLNTVVLKFERFKIAEYDVELSIYGEGGEVPRASKYLCEECADIYFSLEELKFCVYAGENQKHLLKEYVEIYSPRKSEDT